MKTIKSYIKPSVKVVAFRVEGGFQAYKLSHNITDGDLFNTSNQENWTSGGSLFEGWGTATSSE
jgi:hypothetical protein